MDRSIREITFREARESISRKIREKNRQLETTLGQMLGLDQAMDKIKAEIEVLESLLRKIEKYDKP